MQALSDRIKARLEELDLSYAACARQVGVTKGAVSQWCNGDTKNLQNQHLKRLATVLRVRMEWLVDGELPKQALSPEQMHWLQLIESLPPEKRQALRALVGEGGDEKAG